MSRDKATKYDPRGLIAESYHIENITENQAKSIFLDWVITDLANTPETAMRELWARFGAGAPAHPMSVLLAQGMAAKPTRRQKRRS